MRTAVVTGGSAGIGLAIAERLLEDDYAVAILARDEARLLDAKALLERRAGTRVLAIPADVADAGAVQAAAARAEAELGPIEVWVNNAMATVVAPAAEITPAEWRRVTDVTYLGQVYGTLAALQYMKPRDRGIVVQISSGLGVRGVPLQSAYCAAKFAVRGFTDALRAELHAKRSRIALTVAFLPAVNTPQPGWARNRTGHAQVLPDPLYDPRLVAQAVSAVVARPEREIWIGRTAVQMSVAQTLMPAIADRVAAGFGTSQLGDPAPNRDGNLDAPIPGPARIDGDATDRVKGTRFEYFTSRGQEALKLGAAATLLGLGALAGWWAGRGSRRRRF